jgi:hypothetical protein
VLDEAITAEHAAVSYLRRFFFTILKREVVPAFFCLSNGHVVVKGEKRKQSERVSSCESVCAPAACLCFFFCVSVYVRACACERERQYQRESM